VPYPTAREQAYAAIKYVAEYAMEFNVDPCRPVAAGDSTGGNMTVAVTCCQGMQRPGHCISRRL